MSKSKKLRTLIVDDELMARTSLMKLCKDSEFIELVDVLEDGSKLQEILTQSEIDLVFLDVEMPGKSGLDLIKEIRPLPQVILTTSNIEYAYDAIENDVTDFVKKPILKQRLFAAIEKAVNRHKKLNEISLASKKQEIYIKEDSRLIRLAYAQILFFESAGDYVKVYTVSKTHIILATLKYIEEKLDHSRFIKVHRSYIVNLSKVVDIEDNSLVIQEKVIPISRAYKSVLLSRINIL